MSAAHPGGGMRDSGKKAVHVKWAGKTIALGTFPANEADEKCARAKALTRAWRSTMRPKPSRDWVMLELERLGVRVVSGRLGRKAGEEGDDDVGGGGGGGGGKKGVQPPGSMGVAERSNSIGWGTDADLSNLMMARRNSSLGLSMMNDRRGSLGSLGAAVGLDPGDVNMPPHRPLVGGGAAAAYEAARHDHFTQKSAEQQRRASSLGLGSLGGSMGGVGGMPVNPNQHYEMLKLHHMNLLNEIQETTLMMNLYQQQQLQQQQQQLQQQAGGDQMGGGGGQGGDPNMSMLLQQQGGNDMFNSRASLGLGGSQLGGGGFPGGNPQMQMMQQQQQQQQMMQGGPGMSGAPGSSSVGGPQDSGENMDGRLAQLKQEIARNDGGDGGSAGNTGDGQEKKRPADEGDAGESTSKRTKTEGDVGATSAV